MENKISLTPEQLDALKEIGNVGAGNAATALGQLLGKKVLVNVPRVTLSSVDQISDSEFTISPNEISIAVSLRILGSLKGAMLVLFPQKSALMLVDILMHRKPGITELLTLVDASALSESSHILSSSYLNAVGEFLMVHRLFPLVSQITVDRMDRLNKLLIKGFLSSPDGYILPIENRLMIEDIEVDLFVIFLLEYASIRDILTTLGL